MRGLLLAASLVAVRALPTRLRTRANAAETALADTKVDGDRVLPAMQRLDADLEESERRHLRPKTRELERTTAGRIECKNVINPRMTLVEAYDACSGTKRQGKLVRSNTYQCYFFVKKGVFPLMQRKCSSHLTDAKGEKIKRDGWHPWAAPDGRAWGIDNLTPCVCMAETYKQYKTFPKTRKGFGGLAVKKAGLAALMYNVWTCVEDAATEEEARLSSSTLSQEAKREKAVNIARDKIAQCGFSDLLVQLELA